MHPVGPHIHVVGAGQVPAGEGAGLGLPLHGQPGDHRRGQPGTGAQELLQRGHEIGRRQSVQVEQWQHLVDLRGLAAPGGQDRRGEPPPLAADLVDAFVVDPRRLDLDRSGTGEHLPRPRVTVAHHQPATLLVQLARVRGDVSGDLALQRRGEHPAGTVTHDLIDQRTAGRGRHGHHRWRRLFRVDYGKHGRTLPTRVGARALLDSWLGTRREGTPPDTHPQISSIALCMPSDAQASRCGTSCQAKRL